MCGLPEKQLSFLLRAGCDTLPTPMNLAQWNQKCPVRAIFEQAARVAISCSYRIFNARASGL